MKKTTRVPVRIECSMRPTLLREGGRAVSLPAPDARVCMTRAEILRALNSTASFSPGQCGSITD